MKKLFTFLFTFISLLAFSQTTSVAYSHEYEFKEGVFLTVNDFAQNNPIPKSSIVSGIPKSQIDFLKQVVEQKLIIFKDTAGKELKLETSSIWGYCQNRAIYININNPNIRSSLGSPNSINYEFARLNVIGSLCHFTTKIINPFGIYPDPMTNYNSNLSGLSNTHEELGQFVFNIQTNKAFYFSVENMEIFLKNNDSELYNQFMALKRRQKPDAIFVYLRKFNDKHPLYLPEK